MSYKIFTRECEKGTQKVLWHSEACVQYLSCREEDGTVYYIRKHEAGDTHILVYYQSHLIAKEFLPEDIDTFMFNEMSRKYLSSFVNHPDYNALIMSTGEITNKPPTNTVLAHNFKVTYSPADSFKKSIKRDAGIFTTFKEGKYWDTWRRNTLATTSARRSRSAKFRLSDSDF